MPVFINIVLNVLIFKHVRASTRRVQPQTISTNININNNQQARISRREILLLRHMIFMFSMFIGGWSPIFFLTVINELTYVNQSIYQSCILLCEISALSIILNLYMRNHQLRQYILNNIRHCFMH